MSLESIQVFESRSEAYKRAFQMFLLHTDEKRKARAWLQDLVQRMRMRVTLIDAGAGTGDLTG